MSNSNNSPCDQDAVRILREISCARSVREAEKIWIEHRDWYYRLRPREREQFNEELQDIIRELPTE